MVLIPDLPRDDKIVDFENVFLKDTYHHTTRDLVREALQASNPFNHCGNKALALAGDAVIRLVIVDQGLERRKSRKEISKVFEAVACNDNLYRQGVALGLDAFIVKDPSQRGLMAGKKVMATTMEAILGAVYYDSNRNLHDCSRVMAALGLSWPE